MENRIQELIQQHQLAKLELTTLIEELSQIDGSKLSKIEFMELNVLKLRYMEEIDLRLGFISELESIL